MSQQKYPMTPAGLVWMRAALRRIKEVHRPNNVQAIEIARSHGDLSENADYDAAKEEQGMLDAKMREYTVKISLAEVIDPATMSGEKVRFGACVTIENADTGDQTTYTIVGEHEAEIKQGLISVNAPVARALIGNSIGDEVTVKTPAGIREYEIVDVQWKAVEWLKGDPP